MASLTSRELDSRVVRPKYSCSGTVKSFGAKEIIMNGVTESKNATTGNIISTAQRSIVGNATLTAESCNELTLIFNREGLGLGADTVTLNRIFFL